MTRKKWRIRKVMAVPATWQGTPDRFYHFLLGYYVPLLLWQRRTNVRDIAVRDSGPHNPWFKLLDPTTSVEILPAGMMLERYLSHRQERIVLHDWDNPTRFHSKSLEIARSAALALLPKPSAEALEGLPQITILERRPSLTHYRSGNSETLGGAAEWRSVPNIDAIASSLQTLGDVRVLDTAGLSPEDQVQELRRTDVLVGQHGAGLANMIWMKRGSCVVELLPTRPPTIDKIFHNLAAARQLAYQAIPQKSDHSAVDPALVVAAAEQLLSDPHSQVPKPTGSLPIRLWRQRPRRL